MKKLSPINKNGTKKSAVFCPKSEFSSVIATCKAEELQQQVSLMTLDQLNSAIEALKTSTTLDWQEKLQALFKGIESREGLELLGSNLSFEQFIALVDFASMDESQSWKLVPILVVLPQVHFDKMLCNLSDDRKQKLHYLCPTEPFRHHLVLYTHQLKNIFDEFKLPPHIYYPVKILHKKEMISNYFWLHFTDDSTKDIDFSNSKFLRRDPLFINDFENIEVKNEAGLITEWKKDNIKDIYPSFLTIFNLSNNDILILDKLGLRYYISDELFNKLKTNCTGFDYYDLSFPITERSK